MNVYVLFNTFLVLIFSDITTVLHRLEALAKEQTSKHQIALFAKKIS